MLLQEALLRGQRKNAQLRITAKPFVVCPHINDDLIMGTNIRTFCQRCGRIIKPEPGESLCPACKRQIQTGRGHPDLHPPLE